MKASYSTRVTASIGDDTNDQMRGLCEKLDLSLAEFLREAIQYYLEAHED